MVTTPSATVRFALNALLALVYVGAAHYGLMIDAVSGFATLVWPPSGIALAALVRIGGWLWPGVAAGALAANIWNGAPWWVACGIALGNTLEAVVGAWLIERLRVRLALDRGRDVLGLASAALVSTIVSAAVGVASLLAGGIAPPERVALTFRAWWLGDLIGDLIVASVLLIWSSARSPARAPRPPSEAVALAAACLWVGLFVFHELPLAWPALRQAYLLFPLLIWAGLRFEQRGAAITTFVASALAIAGTARGLGPFANPALHEGLIQLQAFMAIVALTGLSLGAVTAERLAAQAALRRERNVLQSAEREAQRHAARVQLLADAARIYSDATVDLRGTMEAIVRQIASTIGDGCSIRLLTADRRALETVAVHHPNPELQEMSLQLGAELQDVAGTLTGRVIESGAPLLVPQVDAAQLAASVHPRYRAYAERFPVHSLLVVPLRAHGKTIGTVTLARSTPGRPYDQDDQVLLGELAERAALAIENARLLLRTQEAIRMRDEFLSIASHELRTPLSALMLQLGGMRRLVGDAHTPAQSKLSSRLDKVVRAADRLSKLVDTLLDVSRIASRRLELQLERCDLSELTRELAERAGEEARAARSELRVRADTPVVGSWDRLRLEQVVTNLLSNAIKYGSGRPIEVNVELAGEAARLSVRDHGIGIAKGDVDRIFERFERAVSVQHYGGLGLGLYIARQIVEAHGGAIHVASEPAAGTTFTIELPRRAGPASDPSAPAANAGTHAG